MTNVLLVELARQTQELLAETGDPEERWVRLKEAIGKLAQLRHEESHAGQLRLKQDQWQARQKEAEAESWSLQKLFPIHASLLQHNFHQLMTDSNPGAQAVVLQTLERLTKKRPAGDPATEAKPREPTKPFQAKSSHAGQPNPTGSN